MIDDVCVAIDDDVLIQLTPYQIGQSPAVLLTWSQGENGSPDYQSGQWMLTVKDAGRIAVALYVATQKAVR